MSEPSVPPPALPVLHVSIAVSDLDSALAFYTGAFGCRTGRRRDRFADVWFFGAQLTLYLDPTSTPAAVGAPVGHRQHFGATVDTELLQRVVAAVSGGDRGRVVNGPATSGDGPRQQTKAMLADPDGNQIELKAYADPAVALAD